MTVNPEPTGPGATDPTAPPPGAPPGGAMERQPVAGVRVRRVGKTRNPWGVWLLTFVTLGIYGLYWYYKVNDEVREYDRSIDVEPVLSLLALFVPIVNWVSIYRTGDRISRAQQSAGSAERCSPVAGLLLWLFVFGTGMVYYQSQLNKVWDVHGNPEPGVTV